MSRIYNFKMVAAILEKFKIVKNLELESSMHLMVLYILEIGFKTIITVKVLIFILMDKDTRDNFNKVSALVKERYTILMVTFTKDNGTITKRMDMESKYMQMDKNMKVNGNKINVQDKESCILMII